MLRVVAEALLAALLLIAFLALIAQLTGCGYGSTWYRLEKAAWEKDGACSTVCDYRQGYMSTAYTLSPTECRCYTPQLREFNEGRRIPLDNPEVTYTCYPDCKTEATKICAYQSWRCPEF